MKFLRGSTDGCIVFNDVVRERDGTFLRQTFQDGNLPCNYCLWQYMQGRRRSERHFQRRRRKRIRKTMQNKNTPFHTRRGNAWREWWISIYLYAIFIFTIKMIH